MSHIKTYARIRPSEKNYDDYEVTPNRMHVRVPEHVTSASMWGPKARGKNVINHEFKFDHVFRENASQEEVFNRVAVSTVQGFLNGYNGTIFAYGQTGSGKTFTVEGGARKYSDRGLAPRALSMIYSALAARTEEDIQVKVSYMEIYQEVGYDLLNTAARNSSVVVPFPKVAVVEGAKGSCLIRNLSMHLAASEEVAQNLLFQGKANRKVAETPMNQRSSRSHAVFTIYLTAKQPNSDVVVKSKLHLVDLAGSERVSKTGTIGLQLSEAKYINLSLHYLEGVIIALQKEATGQGANRSGRPFSSNSAIEFRLYNRWVNSVRSTNDPNSPKYVPYRNSLLTMVLRDSLGGNCQTVMIATVAMEPYNLLESLSTCRFAQRVACITNTLRKNEEIDDKSMIRRLRKRIAELETQLNVMREANPDESVLAEWTVDSKLTDEDKLDCARITEAYLSGRLKDPVMAGITNPVKFRECLHLLRKVVQETGNSDIGQYIRPVSAPVLPSNTEEPPDRVQHAWGEDTVSPACTTNTDNITPTTTALHPKSLGNRSVSMASFRTESSIPIHNDSELGSRVSFASTNTIIGKESNLSRPNTGSTVRSQNFNANFMNSAIKKHDTHILGNNKFKSDLGSSSNPSHNNVLQRCNSMNSSASSLKPVKHNTRKNTGSSQLSKGREPVVSGPVNGRLQKYKSPFERAREREITQLDKKLEKKNKEIQNKRQDLTALQEDVKRQKLLLLKNEISGKLDKTKAQLKEQQAYLARLEEAHSTSNILEQERLVEKQLKKRESKMKCRVELLEQELNKLSQENQNPGEVAVAAKPGTKQNMNPAVTHNEGKKVNSRDVLERLQSQEKEQAKVATKLEKQKILTLSEQVELKETATRHKLQAFREKLRMSQHREGTFGQSSPMSCSTFDAFAQIQPAKDTNETSPPASSADVKFSSPKNTLETNQLVNSVNEQNHHNLERNSHSNSKPSQQDLSPVSLQTNMAATTNLSLSDQPKQAVDSATSFSKLLSNGQTNQRQMDSELLMKRLMERQKSASSAKPKTASMAWDSAYSRDNSRPQTQDSFNMGTASSFAQIHDNHLQFTASVSNLNGYEDTPEVDRLVINHENSSSFTEEPSTKVHNPFKGYFGDSIRKHINSDPFQKEHHLTSNSQPTVNKTRCFDDNSLFSNSQNATDTSKLLEITQESALLSNDVEVIPCKPQDDEFERRPRTSTKDSDNSIPSFERRPRTSTKDSDNSIPSFEKYLPTDYVNQNHEESFDGRKMGLRHKDFDTALQDMLNGDDSKKFHINTDQIAPEFNDYNQFARSKNPKNTKHLNSSTSSPYTSNGRTINSNKPKPPNLHKSSSKQTAQTANASKKSAGSRSLWGPEAKFMSVSDRLKGYLNNESTGLRKGHSLDDSALQPTKKPTRITEETTDGLSGEWKKKKADSLPKPEIDLDKYKIKIRAANEATRPMTYENTAQVQRERVNRIRRARSAAETIQRAWRNYKLK